MPVLVKHALKVAIAAALVGWVFQGSQQIAYFIYPVMGLITTMQSSLGGTVKAAWGRLGGSAIGGVIGAWLNSTHGASPMTAGLAFILSTLFCEILQLQAPFNQAGTLSALIAVSLIGKGSPWSYAFNRVLDNWIGVVIGVAVTLLFWPDHPRKTLLDNLIQVLSDSDQAFQTIVAVYRSEKSREPVASHLITEMTSRIEQSESLLKQEMYGPVGSQLAEENWSALLAAERRLCRYLSVMLKALQRSHSRLLSRQFVESLVLMSQQVSAICADLTQVVQVTSARSGLFSFGRATARSSMPTVPEILTLKNHLQSIIDQISRMRMTGAIRDYPHEEIRQLYVFLHGLKEFIQELEQLAIALLHREIAAKPDVKPGFKLHPATPERVRHILKTGVAVGLSLVILNDWLHLPFDYYAIIAVVVAMQPTFGKSITAGRQRVFATGIGAVFALCLIHTLGGNPFTLALGIVLTILTCAYLGFGQGYVAGCILVTLAILAHGADPNGYVWGRFIETLIGTVIALILSQLLWPNTAAQQLNQGVSQTLIKLGSLYEMLMSSYLKGTDLQAGTQLTREIQKSLQTQALLQTETQQEPVYHLTAPRTQCRWNYLLSYEKELFENLGALQDAVEQGTGVNLPQDLQKAVQVVAQATILSFNDLAAVEQSNPQQFSSPLPTFDAVEQVLLKLRNSGTGVLGSLDQVISFIAVFLAMQEIAENLNQMATDWSSPTA